MPERHVAGSLLDGHAPWRSEAAWITAIVAGHVALTGFLAWALNVWIDEIFTLETTGRGPAHAFRRAIGFELQPPLYFVALSLWRFVSSSDFWARAFSVLCTAGAILVMRQVVRRYLPSVGPVPVLAAFAFHPFAVWAAVEARVYALVILLACGLLLAFHGAYLGERVNRRWAVAHAALAVAALLTQHYLGFLLLSQGASLLALRRWAPLKGLVTAMAVVAVLVWPMLWLAVGQAGAHQSRADAGVPWPEALRTVYWRFQGYALPLMPVLKDTWWQEAHKWLWRGLIVAACGSVAWRRRWLPRDQAALLAAAAVLLASFGALLALLGPEVVELRHTAAAFPVAFAAVFVLVAVVPVPRVAWAVAAAALGLSAQVLVAGYRDLSKPPDWREIAAFVTASEAPGQRILVFTAWEALPFRHYYRGQNEVVPLPHEAPADRFDPADVVFGDEQAVESRLGYPKPGQQFWLVDSGAKAYLGVDYRGDSLDGYMGRCYATVASRVIDTVELSTLRRESCTPAP